LELLEDRSVPSVSITATNNNGNGYAGLDFNHSGGYVPPDTVGAAGPTNYVETVNQTVAIYSPKATGASSTTSSLSTFWFTTGRLAHTDPGSGLSDPVVVYNDQIGRFIVGDQDVDFRTHLSTFDIAVSKSSSPGSLTTTDWNFYQITTTESGFDADFPGNFGYNHDAFVVTLNMFGVLGGGHLQILSLNNTDLANGVSQASLHFFRNDLNDFSVRPTVMHDSVAGDPMWLVTEHGDNHSIDVIKMTGVLSTSPTFVYTNLAVTPYSSIVNPLNPNGTVITTNIDTRIQKAAEWNGVIVAVHNVSISSTQDVIQWYVVNVGSGTPTLKDQGRISAGNNTYLTYPSIDINSASQIGVTYMGSGKDTSTDYMSMYVTGRNASDPAGTMENSVLVPAGTGQANYHDFSSGGRAGDISGINVDPSDGSFWAANEFANTEATANWGTAIANFTISNPVSTTHLSVSPTTSTPTAGVAFSITVSALTASNTVDPTYRGTVHFTSSDGRATLPGDYTFVAADNGMHTFTNGVTLVTATSQSVTATDTVTSTITGNAPVTVSPAAASTFTVSGFPSPVMAGTGSSFSVTAKDTFGNTATGYTGTVRFTSSDGQAMLPGNSTLSNGTGTFNATLKTAGAQSLTATDTMSSSITGSQTGITVNPAAASIFAVMGFPSPVTAGVAGSLTVTAKDAFGNTVTGYGGTVHFTSSDGQASLPANSRLTNGTGSFNATLKTAGAQSITATDTVNSGITGNQAGITVNPAAASTLVVSGFPSPQTAGITGGFTVTAKDAFGNTATGYGGTVHFTSSDGQASLPANSTLSGGSGSFGATLKTAGTQSITATDTVTSSITGTQSGITVNAASANHLVVSAPASSTSGVAFSITVTAQDAFNNTATTYGGTIHFMSSDSGATVPGNYTFIAADNGVHTFTNGVTLQAAGPQSVTATDTLTSTITGMATINVVAPAPATHFAVSAPVATTAGAAFSVTVTALDATNNTATGYRGTVRLTSSDGGATLPVDHPFVAADNGVFTFTGVILVTAGGQSVTATDTVSASITGIATVTVNPAAASTLVVSGFPSSVTAGTAGTFTVTAKDAFNNIATGYSGTIQITSSDGQAMLPANSTLSSGTGSFTATLKTAGTQSLTATDTVTSSITGTQPGIAVSPAAATAFVVGGFPSPSTAGVAGSFTVTAKDPYGNTAIGYAGTVQFSSSDPKAAFSPASSMLTNGTGTFSATLFTAGTQSITATDSVTSTITGSQTGINVTPAAASTLIVGGFPSPTTVGVAGNFTVTAKDPFGNTATGYTGTVQFTSSDGNANLPGPSTLPSGVGSFSATFQTTGTQSITATDTVTASITGTQSGIVVNNLNADLAVSASGPAAANEGDSVTYNITVTNAGPNAASSVSLTDTLPSILSFQSATSSQGSFTVSGGVVTFSLGAIAASGSATASVTALAIEDGTVSDTASVASTTPDSNTTNNNSSATTSFAEPAISVSAPIRTRSRGSTNFQVATFTHAGGVEPTSAFAATIDWGDGITSAGTITLSGTTYAVTGSHFYEFKGFHTITTTVTETGSSPVGGDKFGDERPGDDVVRLTPDFRGSGGQGTSSIQASGVTPTSPAGADFFASIMFVTQQPVPATSITGSTAQSPHAILSSGFMEELFGAEVKSLVESLQTLKHSETPADWFSDSWLVDAWLKEVSNDSGAFGF
jgi:hypothetical protein